MGKVNKNMEKVNIKRGKSGSVDSWGMSACTCITLLRRGGGGTQAVEECLRLLGCERDYSAATTEERVELLSAYLASPPPKDKIEVHPLLSTLSLLRH